MKRLFAVIALMSILLFQSTESQEKKEFKVISGQPIDLEEIQKMIKVNENKLNYDGVVTVAVKFILNTDDQASTKEVYVDDYLPRSGNNRFINYIKETIDTWRYPMDARPNGTLYYTVSSEGSIKLYLQNPLDKEKENVDVIIKNFIKNPEYVMNNGKKLILAKGFIDQNLITPIREQKDFFDKLTMKFSIVFGFFVFALLGISIYVWFHSSLKLIPKEFPEFYLIMNKLWKNAIFYVNEQLDFEGREGKVELILDIFSKDIDNEINVLKRIHHLLNGAEIKERIGSLNLGKYTPKIEWEKLKKQIDYFVEEIEKNQALTTQEKMDIIKDSNAYIWQYYSRPFLEVARFLCSKYGNYRSAKIFLAGLENHLNNSFHWYTSNEIDRAVTKTAQKELSSMLLGLDWVWTISGVAPMIGLFGTVIGISKSFEAISLASGGMEQSVILTSLAGGINEALYTTIVGLVIGISSILIYYFFKSKIDRNSVNWEIIVTDITRKF